MPAFLLVPGLNCDARVYAGVAQALWPAGSVAIANHRVAGRMEEIARAMLADAPPQFGLVGFSMGGYLAFEILRQAPERVTKLALLDTNARADSQEATANRRRMIALARKGRFIEAIDQTFPKAVHVDNKDNADLYAIHRGMAEANGPQMYEAHQEAIIGRPDSRAELGAIRVPTLIVVGEGDQITPPDMAEEMEAGIAGSVLKRIPRAGHMALLEQPELVHDALRVWAAA